LSNCGIKDEGAISLFEELKNTHNVKSIELSNNPITEKAFDSLIGALEKNKSIQRIEITGISANRKVALNMLSPYSLRLTF
jgi:Ran GTPase-activating protein (RanGAP) involved in mRNA processing and transport